MRLFVVVYKLVIVVQWALYNFPEQCHTVISNLAKNMHNFVPVGHHAYKPRIERANNALHSSSNSRVMYKLPTHSG